MFEGQESRSEDPIATISPSQFDKLDCYTLALFSSSLVALGVFFVAKLSNYLFKGVHDGAIQVNRCC